LLKIADVYDDEVDNAVAALTSILEPLMIVFLAVVVGTIVIALFLRSSASLPPCSNRRDELRPEMTKIRMTNTEANPPRVRHSSSVPIHSSFVIRASVISRNRRRHHHRAAGGHYHHFDSGGLILSISSYVQNKGVACPRRNEIAAMSAALES
jgi:hypothetical protein